MLEEMPPFPERESSILAILKKKSGRIPDISKTPRAANPHASERPQVGRGSTHRPGTVGEVPIPRPAQGSRYGCLGKYGLAAVPWFALNFVFHRLHPISQ